jgi:Fic family protein
MPSKLTFKTTHPWLSFQLDLKRCPPTMWMALGEAQSKCQHLAGVALKPSVAIQLHRMYLAKGVHATTAIEGNTLTEEQVAERILQRSEGVSTVPESQKYLETEVDNVLDLCDSISIQCADDGFIPITVDDVKSYNSMLLHDLEHEDHVVPGSVRTTSVGVNDYRGPEFRECEHLLGELCTWLNGPDFQPPNDWLRIGYGIIKAVIAHLYLAWIHAFGDGNGRTARVVEVRFLMEAGVPSSAAHLLSNHYNLTRTEYYRKLSHASKSGGDVTEFLRYSVDGFLDQLREQLKLVKQYQWDTAWENYIYELFGNDKSLADKRQIKLLLGLSARNEWVEKSELKRLDVDLAAEYAMKTSRTISRDINRLAEQNLIISQGSKVRANKSLILAFLPRQNQID